MRCPKCQYLSFDAGDRCRNCGYEFALAADDAPIPDLPIQTGDEPLGPLADFSLTDPDVASPRARVPSSSPLASADAPAARKSSGTASLDLPLFTTADEDDRPLVVPPAVPRPPLSVRRSAPARGSGSAADDAERDEFGAAREAARRRQERPAASESAAAEGMTDAGSVARLFAMLLDSGLLLAIDAAVIYFTLRICGFTVAEIRLLPPVPLGGFLLMIHAAYLVVFTAAGGQTIGKMATGLRVVPADAGSSVDRVPLGQAITRAAASLITVLTVGLGYLPALVGTRRAVHDRLADTRVVRA